MGSASTPPPRAGLRAGPSAHAAQIPSYTRHPIRRARWLWVRMSSERSDPSRRRRRRTGYNPTSVGDDDYDSISLDEPESFAGHHSLQQQQQRRRRRQRRRPNSGQASSPSPRSLREMLLRKGEEAAHAPGDLRGAPLADVLERAALHALFLLRWLLDWLRLLALNAAWRAARVAVPAVGVRAADGRAVVFSPPRLPGRGVLARWAEVGASPVPWGARLGGADRGCSNGGNGNGDGLPRPCAVAARSGTPCYGRRRLDGVGRCLDQGMAEIEDALDRAYALAGFLCSELDGAWPAEGIADQDPKEACRELDSTYVAVADLSEMLAICYFMFRISLEFVLFYVWAAGSRIGWLDSCDECCPSSRTSTEKLGDKERRVPFWQIRINMWKVSYTTIRRPGGQTVGRWDNASSLAGFSFLELE